MVKTKTATSIVPKESIEHRIYLIRGQKVMLDRDLALLYQVRPIALRQQVKRNKNRFPDDFIFQLTDEEARILVSQNVIPSRQSLGGYLPYAFTEQGVAMLSAVLKSRRAVLVSVAIMRVFAQLRQVLVSHQEILRRLDALEQRFERHDEDIDVIFRAIRKLIDERKEKIPVPRRIGFSTL